MQFTLFYNIYCILTSIANMEIKISFFMCCCSPLFLKDHSHNRTDVAGSVTSRLLQTGVTILIQTYLSVKQVFFF